jgi:hypothetical protein
MGQSASLEEDSQEIRAFHNNYVFVKKFTDTRFGEVKLLQEKTLGTKVLQRDYTSHSAKDYQEYLKDCKSRVALTHPNAIKLHGYSTKKEDAFCADFYKVSFFFECFDLDLEQEIQRRQQSKEFFSETELWYVLDSIVSAGAYFQTNNAPVGDIRPFNILITPGYEYKIVDQGIFGKRALPNYFGLIQGLETKSHYLAPEIFKALKTNKKINSQYKADVFSLGMTLIEATNLEALDKCYDWDKFTFDEALLAQALNKMKTRYSEKFVKTIERLVLISDELREDFIGLDRILDPFRKEIRKKAPATVEIVKEILTIPIMEKKPEYVKKSAPPKAASPEKVQAQPISDLADIDRRVIDAVKLTADTLAYQPQTTYPAYQPTPTPQYQPYVQPTPTPTPTPAPVSYDNYHPVTTYQGYQPQAPQQVTYTPPVHEPRVEYVQPQYNYDPNPQYYQNYQPTTTYQPTVVEHPVVSHEAVKKSAPPTSHTVHEPVYTNTEYVQPNYPSQTYTQAPATTTNYGTTVGDFKFDASVMSDPRYAYLFNQQGVTTTTSAPSYTNQGYTTGGYNTGIATSVVDTSPTLHASHDSLKKSAPPTSHTTHEVVQTPQYSTGVQYGGQYDHGQTTYSQAPTEYHDVNSHGGQTYTQAPTEYRDVNFHGGQSYTPVQEVNFHGGQSYTPVQDVNYHGGQTYTPAQDVNFHGGQTYTTGHSDLAHSYVAPSQSTYIPPQQNWQQGGVETVKADGNRQGNGEQVYTFDYTVPQGMSVNQFLNQLGIKDGQQGGNVTVTTEQGGHPGQEKIQERTL